MDTFVGYVLRQGSIQCVFAREWFKCHLIEDWLLFLILFCFSTDRTIKVSTHDAIIIVQTSADLTWFEIQWGPNQPNAARLMMFTLYPIQSKQEKTDFFFFFWICCFFRDWKCWNAWYVGLSFVHLFIWLPHKCLETFSGAVLKMLLSKRKMIKTIEKSHKTWSRTNKHVRANIRPRFSSVYFNNSQSKFNFW